MLRKPATASHNDFPGLEELVVREIRKKMP